LGYSDKIKIKHEGGGVGNGGGAGGDQNGGAGGGGEHTVTVGTAPKGSKGKKLRFPVRPDILFLMAACRSQALNPPCYMTCSVDLWSLKCICSRSRKYVEET
jgi:hypothetical protein